ncbi:MAG: hypothetical protein K2X52_31155 [Mycobacteriaceae bacterium]|nr:hypothetical protein [Mycobacteriaceae bacterium]
MNNSGEVRRRQGDVILGSARPDRWHGDDVDAASTAASKGRNGPAMLCGTAAPTTICLVQQRLSDYVCGSRGVPGGRPGMTMRVSRLTAYL